MSEEKLENLRDRAAALCNQYNSEFADTYKIGDSVQWISGKRYCTGTIKRICLGYKAGDCRIVVKNTKTGKEYMIGEYWLACRNM